MPIETGSSLETWTRRHLKGWDSRLERDQAVLFVSASGWLGGPGRSLLTLMANLPKRVGRILVSPTNGDLLEAIDARGIRVRHLPLFRRRGRIGVPLGRLIAITMLTLWIVRNRRGLVAIHANGYSELHLIALGAALSRVPVVAWFHGYQADPWDKRLGPIWRRLIQTAASSRYRNSLETSSSRLVWQLRIRSRSSRTRSIPGRSGGTALRRWWIGAPFASGGVSRLDDPGQRIRSSPRNHRADSRAPADLGALPSQGDHQVRR